MSYDTQCEGTRAYYIYELTTYFNDEDYFLLPCIEAFEKTHAGRIGCSLILQSFYADSQKTETNVRSVP